MAEFKSWRSYRRFEAIVLKTSRHVFDQETRDFIDTVLATSESRRRPIPRGTALYRVQIGNVCRKDEFGTKIPVPYPSDRMRPQPDSAREGRVNPKGIPCLYLSTDPDTCMSDLSVAIFKVSQDLSLIDCSQRTSIESEFRLIQAGREPESTEREGRVWNDIHHAFSTPVSPTDSTAEYAPTQILADAFRTHGYDGVVYKSLLGSGVNVALFNIESAYVISRQVFTVQRIQFVFNEVSNPEFELPREQ